MSGANPPSRRDVLRLLGGAGVAVGASALSGCTSGAASREPTATSAASMRTSRAVSSPVAPSSSGAAGAPDYAGLSRRLSRPLLRPGSPGYGSAARLYSPRFDASSRPAAVAGCATEDDVAECIRFAGTSRVPFALRAGGHSYGGWSTTRGLLIDTSALASVAVDRTANVATIAAGARLVDVYAALARAGRALAAGSCPTVGLTGLALGGGVGPLTRAFGLTCDALRSARVVTAEGRARTVDAGHDADLFWALRGGGGGSFAAVTSLSLALRPAPRVQTFFFEFPFDRAADVLDAWQAWLPGTDPALWSTCKLLADPAQGALHVTVSGTWVGPAAALDAQLAPLLARTGAPSTRNANDLSYGDAMLLEAGCSGQDATSCRSDALGPTKRQPFAATSSIVATAMPRPAIDAAVSRVRAALDVPSLVEGGVSFDALGGAVADVRGPATPFPYRSALASVQYTATWSSGSTPPTAFDGYVRGFRAALTRWLGRAAYVNYADASIADFGPAYWGPNFARLQQVKKAYDPDQLFTFAQAVRPA